MLRIAVVILGFVCGVIGWLLIARPAMLPSAPVKDVSNTDAPARLPGLGSYRMQVRVEGEDARDRFDQGLTLGYAFNHAAARRAFLAAAELDPDCAMCWWGAAWVLGPHLNAGMDAANVPAAWEYVQRARQLAEANGDAREQAYIAALARRYAPHAGAARDALDRDYAQAMRELAAQFPHDLDARVLQAEALMDLHPWDLYDGQGRAKAWTGEIVAILERVLADAPEHPGANHLYIHAVEASRTPERALVAARRLETLAPGAGHLVHMSSHIYLRTGRYHEASEANRRAIDADLRYLELCRPGDTLYARGYVPHNHHFLYASSLMEGRSAQAIEAAEAVAQGMDLVLARQPGYEALQYYWVTPLLARARFGRWTELLAQPAPPSDLAYPSAIWHYVRGLALLRSGDIDAAGAQHEALLALRAHPDIERGKVWSLYRLADLVEIATRVLGAEIAAQAGDTASAVDLLQGAVKIEDALCYDEPAPWYQPVRQVLGAVLLEAGRAGDAQAVFEEDLRRNRENGWSLHGLVMALDAQRRPAQEARARRQAAWKHADVALSASRF